MQQHSFFLVLLLSSSFFFVLLLSSSFFFFLLSSFFRATGFHQTVIGTLVGCGTAFYVGLRVGRTVWSPLLYGVEATNYANLKADAALSVSVGAATACFVGTDLSFGAANWMGGVLGIEDTYSTVQGMTIAGSSTFLGFTACQMMQNVSSKPGHNWVD